MDKSQDPALVIPKQLHSNDKDYTAAAKGHYKSIHGKHPKQGNSQHSIHNSMESIDEGTSEKTFRMMVNVDGFTIEVNEVGIKACASDQEKLTQNSLSARVTKTERAQYIPEEVGINDTSVPYSCIPQIANELIPKRPNPEDVKRNLLNILETGDPFYPLKIRNIDIACSIFQPPLSSEDGADFHSNYFDSNILLSSNEYNQNRAKDAAGSNKELLDGEKSIQLEPKTHLERTDKRIAANYWKNSNSDKQSKCLLNDQLEVEANNLNSLELSTDYSNLNSSSIDYKMTSESTTIDLDLLNTKSLLPESPLLGYRLHNLISKTATVQSNTVTKTKRNYVNALHKKLACESKTVNRQEFIPKISEKYLANLKLKNPDNKSQSYIGTQPKKQTLVKIKSTSLPSISKCQILHNLEEPIHPAKRRKLDLKSLSSAGSRVKTENVEKKYSCTPEQLLSYSTSIESVVAATYARNCALTEIELIGTDSNRKKRLDEMTETADSPSWHIKSETLDLDDLVIIDHEKQ